MDTPSYADPGSTLTYELMGSSMLPMSPSCTAMPTRADVKLFATDIEIHAREVLNLRKRLDEIIADHTGQEIDKVRTDTERDYFMSAAEAKDYGIIDKVIVRRGEMT